VITLEDVRAYLTDNKIEGTWDDERVSGVLAAEHGAQRSVLDLPSPRPAEADEALLRRVVHNLTTSTSKAVERIGIHGDGVRDLERLWSRRRAAEPTEAPAPRANTQSSRRKRAAKKTAATSATTPKENS
jgi:hypothetical protein